MGFFKRKQRVVHKQIQWGAVGFIFFVTLAILAFHTWLTYASMAGATSIGRQGLTRLLVQNVGVTVLVMAAFVVFLGILGTHKLAGPIYRFQGVLKQIQKGDISEVMRLRNGDMLMDFMGDLNLALANLREIAAEDRNAVDEARFYLQHMRAATDEAEATRALDAALAALDRIGKRLILVKGAQAERTALRRIVPGLVPAVPGAAPLAPPPPPPQARPAAQGHGPAAAAAAAHGGPQPSAATVPAMAAMRPHAQSPLQRTAPFQPGGPAPGPGPLPAIASRAAMAGAANPAGPYLPPQAPRATAEFQSARTVAGGLAPPSAADLAEARGGAPGGGAPRPEAIADLGVLQSARTVVAPMAPPSPAELAQARAAAGGGRAPAPEPAPPLPPVAPVDIANARTVAEPMRALTREQAIRRLEDHG